MVNYLNDCSCNTGIIYGVAQCRACGSDGCGGNAQCQVEITQKRIWNSVRVAASEYVMNLGALTVYQKPYTIPMFNNVNWNQMSDRALPANSLIQNIQRVPSHGNSTKSSISFKVRPHISNIFIFTPIATKYKFFNRMIEM